MVVHSCTPTIQEAEAESEDYHKSVIAWSTEEVTSYLGLHSKKTKQKVEGELRMLSRCLSTCSTTRAGIGKHTCIHG